jgi:hypothetical protein
MLVINRGCEKWGFEPDNPEDCPSTAVRSLTR